MRHHLLQTIRPILARSHWLLAPIVLGIVLSGLVNGLADMAAGALTVVPLPEVANDTETTDEDGDVIDLCRLFLCRDDVLRPLPPRPSPQTASAVQPATACENLPLSLAFTVIAEKGEWDHAVVNDGSGGGFMLARVGKRLGDVDVISIERNRLVVALSDELHCLLLPGIAPTDPTQPTIAEGPHVIPLSEGAIVPDDATVVARPRGSLDIRRTGRHQYEISRELIERLLGNPARFAAHQPALSQSLDGGRPNGLRIERIPDGSFLEQLGFRRGDILRSVNGEPVRTWQGAINLWSALLTQDQFDIQLTRHDRAVVVNVTVR